MGKERGASGGLLTVSPGHRQNPCHETKLMQRLNCPPSNVFNTKVQLEAAPRVGLRPSVRRRDVTGVQDTVAAATMFALVVSVRLSPDCNGLRWALCQSSFQIPCSQCPRSSRSLDSRGSGEGQVGQVQRLSQGEGFGKGQARAGGRVVLTGREPSPLLWASSPCPFCGLAKALRNSAAR